MAFFELQLKTMARSADVDEDILAPFLSPKQHCLLSNFQLFEQRRCGKIRNRNLINID